MGRLLVVVRWKIWFEGGDVPLPHPGPLPLLLHLVLLVLHNNRIIHGSHLTFLFHRGISARGDFALKFPAKLLQKEVVEDKKLLSSSYGCGGVGVVVVVERKLRRAASPKPLSLRW